MSTLKSCRHIMPKGRTCKSPAMRGSAYCYYHGPQKSPRRTTRPAEEELQFEPVQDPASVSLIADRILRAMAANRISKGRAAVMFQGLQTILASYRVPAADALDPGPDLGLGFGPSLDLGLARDLLPPFQPAPQSPPAASAPACPHEPGSRSR